MSPLHIDRSLFIGDGSERECFHHPVEKALCIKIPHTQGKKKQHEHDMKLYKKLSAMEPEVWQHIAPYKGKTITDLGEGLLFEKITDYDGKVSISLLRYLYEYPERIDEPMLEALKRLEIFVKTYNIILKDPSPSNLLYKRMDKTRGEFVIIDGIGDLYPNIFPLNLYARARVARQWDKVIARIKKESTTYPALRAEIEKKWKSK